MKILSKRGHRSSTAVTMLLLLLCGSLSACGAAVQSAPEETAEPQEEALSGEMEESEEAPAGSEAEFFDDEETTEEAFESLPAPALTQLVSQNEWDPSVPEVSEIVYDAENKSISISNLYNYNEKAEAILFAEEEAFSRWGDMILMYSRSPLIRSGQVRQLIYGEAIAITFNVQEGVLNEVSFRTLDEENPSWEGQFGPGINRYGEYRLSYNDDGTLSEYTLACLTGQTEVVEYEYDEAGRLVKSMETIDGMPTLLCEYEYGEQGLSAVLVSYSDSGTDDLFATRYVFDGDGRVVLETEDMLSPAGELVSTSARTEYSYDAEGRLSESVSVYFAGDAEEWITTYQYG